VRGRKIFSTHAGARQRPKLYIRERCLRNIRRREKREIFTTLSGVKKITPSMGKEDEWNLSIKPRNGRLRLRPSVPASIGVEEKKGG